MPEAETPNNAASAFDVPRHVAIIMDGNGRWATQRGLSRPHGHKAGAPTVRKVIDECGRLGVEDHDVVFLGDVGLEDGQLTAEQCRLLKGIVEHQATYANGDRCAVFQSEGDWFDYRKLLSAHQYLHG